ncbi:hypothetical protein [Halobaculum litoreum]|uniref:hypothetical protein n=1 Tax=Halobaculum litoreum TaxID=3031998 RepID=UPI0024C439ED|nr:hypothetical protein [Halobaculum sp. DT92]
MSETDGDLPPVIDVYDMLDRIERDADNDEEVPAHLDEIRDLLAEYARRDRSGRASLVDDIDGRVLAVREYLDGDADRWAEGVENRLRVYRDSLREASDRLHLANARLEADGEPLDGAVGSTPTGRSRSGGRSSTRATPATASSDWCSTTGTAPPRGRWRAGSSASTPASAATSTCGCTSRRTPPTAT